MNSDMELPPHEETAALELELGGDERQKRTAVLKSGAGYPMRNAYARHCNHRDRVTGWRNEVRR